ncbi:MAG: endopeptidase La [Clostridiales bacterium]|jgi:ATP-dependent Lon protease|nr:endopeptidase La [Clostridiales bacterium]
MTSVIKSVESKTLITIPLRGVVVFPGIMTSFEISRKLSVKAIKLADENKSELFLITQKDITVEVPAFADLYKVGVVAVLKHVFRLPNGNYQVMVEGLRRGEIVSLQADNDILYSDVVIRDVEYEEDYYEVKKKITTVFTALGNYLQYFSRPSKEILEEARTIEDPGVFSDCIASAFLVKFQDKQRVLDELNPVKRLDILLDILTHEIEIMELEGSIQSKVRSRLSKTQKEIYLREQLRTIENELGISSEYENEDEYRSKIKSKKLPKAVEEKLLDENRKLQKMQFGSPEATVIKNYIETCLELPWNKMSKKDPDIKKAKKILDEDHDGLVKVKERILEFIAVKQLAPDLSGQILCLVGPPGVGKTSIARSIARATNRKYVRISLGGIRDEAEIRGHRKTYIGSMPGRIINALKLAGTSNPVILLDEVDKLTKDAHGDPTSALLEVLDVDQNKTFRDHFIEIPVDLSECIFIATANTTATIPLPLLDRMELIEMDSYSEGEKVSIAKNHLIPKQLKRHGLKKNHLKFTGEAIGFIINGYTKESGVRNLEREIAAVCRKTARGVVEGEFKSLTLDKVNVEKMLGPQKFLPDIIYSEDEQGIVNGLAWTQLGGEMLRIEVLSMPGNGLLELTGSLGDVMKESAKAAVSYIRKHAADLGIEEDFHKKYDIHIHVPEGAIPKDGPSAGITIATGIVSELSGRKVRQNVAMTGEITLTGRVLPIGGLKEKSMAALKAGVNTVIVPKDNLKDIEEFDEDIRKNIEFIGVSKIDEVLSVALREKET